MLEGLDMSSQDYDTASLLWVNSHMLRRIQSDIHMLQAVHVYKGTGHEVVMFQVVCLCFWMNLRGGREQLVGRIWQPVRAP
jgi:hypothetical protein